MRVGMILPGRFPPDIRVEKEFETLKGEHEVFLLCPRRGGQAIRENWQGMEIHRVFSRTERWWSQLNLMARCHSGAWAAAIDSFTETVNADALHVHDLPLLGAALKAAKHHRIPVVADLHENYPAMLGEALKVPVNRITSLGSLASRLSVSVPRWRAYEESVVPKARRVIVVVEEARDRLVRLGVPADNISVVGNYATLDGQEHRDKSIARTNQHDNSRLCIVYAGDFGPTRDLVTVLDAVRALPEQVRCAIDVQLIGGQGRDLAKLRQHVEALGIGEHVTLLQWLPRPEAERLMSEADVGLVPHVKSAHTDATVPHKLFQYMWRYLPVIVSNCAPLERIVRETNCGLVYESGDSQSLANCLLQMHSLQDRGVTLGQAGHVAVASKYNWNNAGESLLAVYRDLASRF